MGGNIHDILLNDEHKIAILIDPDKMKSEGELVHLIKRIESLGSVLIFVGGSTVSQSDFDNCITKIKANTDLPVVIFPGSSKQISDQADGILFLSLISGRNPDFLIGHQVESAHLLKKMEVEVLPTGYMLIDGGKASAVSYISQTTPIPSNQITIAVNTAIAGEMLGLKVLFMDAGSGAEQPISPEMIQAVQNNIDIPLIIGGGIKSIAEIEKAFEAGANLVVIGNRIEEDIDFLLDIKSYLKTRNSVVINY